MPLRFMNEAYENHEYENEIIEPYEEAAADAAVKLPLWRTCLEEILKEEIYPGKVYSVEFFEKHLRGRRNTCYFSTTVSRIRHELFKKGWYLCGRGQKGTQYVILTALATDKMLESFQRSVFRTMQRGVILGTNTRIDTLTPSERRKHEQLVERLAIRLVLFKRTAQIVKIVKANDPKALE